MMEIKFYKIETRKNQKSLQHSLTILYYTYCQSSLSLSVSLSISVPPLFYYSFIYSPPSPPPLSLSHLNYLPPSLFQFSGTLSLSQPFLLSLCCFSISLSLSLCRRISSFLSVCLSVSTKLLILLVG
jgi:hypothetical protein